MAVPHILQALQKVEKLIVDLVEVKTRLTQLANLDQLMVKITTALIELNDPAVDKILQDNAIVVTDSTGKQLFPRTDLEGPKVIFTAKN